jgi:hypothetical protein
MTPQASLAALVTSSPEVIGSTLSVDSTVLPFTIQADTLTTPWAAGAEFFPGDQIVDSNGNVQTATTHGFTDSTVPTWATVVGAFTQDNGVKWVLLPSDTTRVEVLIYNQTFTFLNGVHGFTTGPLTSFTTFTGSVAIDPTIPETLLQIRGRSYDPASGAIWIAGHLYAAGDQIVDSDGNVQTVLVGGLAGPSTHPTWNVLGLGYQTTDNGVTWINVGVPAITPTEQITLLFFQTSDAIVIAPPSGIKAYKNQSVCQLEWAIPSFSGVTVLGVRIMLSKDPTGVSVPFIQFGDIVDPTKVTRSANVVIGQETATNVDGNTTTITTTQTTLPVNYSSVQIVPGDVQNADVFYAMLSTVIQDANGTVFESQQNGPITCGFVNLHVVSPTDFLALQRKEDIAGRLITPVTKLYPDLDLTPRSELRDLIFDPIALELANMSVREYFSRVSTSISAISQLDDANGDGFSDPFDSSSLKQQLARAYGLSASDTQKLIDRQFDILGEQAGVTRGGAAAAVTTLTFFTYVKPTASVTFPIGIQCATVADAETPALTFITRASATIDGINAGSFYNPLFGWYQVTVPAECTTEGSVGNVGAGTIRSVTSGAPNGFSVTNLDPADFGQDTQINSKFAANIQDSLIAGKDSGTRNGYLKAARGTPGVVDARVVAAGDLEMVRDWDPIRQKHVFGCVDIYTRGTSLSEQDTDVAFSYQNTSTYGQLLSYLAATLQDSNLLKFRITDFATLSYGIESALEFLVQRGANIFYFGTANAQFENNDGTFVLDPTELAYQYVGDDVTKVRVPLLINNVPATNRVALAALSSAQAGTYSFLLIAREQSPLQTVPTFQPVLKATSVVGEATGAMDSAFIRLIHVSDFLLEGGSNKAGDTVAVDSTSSLPTSKSVEMMTNTVTIDTAMDVTTDVNGTPGDIISVRSSDLSQLYTFGVDYSIVPRGRYRTYGLNLLTKEFGITNVAVNVTNVVTITAPGNDFQPGAEVAFNNVATATWLNGQTGLVATPGAAFTVTGITQSVTPAAADTGNVVGQNIAPGATVEVSYNKFALYERLEYVSAEAIVLNGTVPTPLAHEGFVHSTWLPESYNITTLSYDGAAYNPDGTINLAASTGLIGALVPHDSRYTKVVFDGKVMTEGLDYTLTVDPTSGAATVARILTGHIGDASTVTVSYFYTEPFTIATQYPAFVEQLANTIAVTKHAAADVLVKAMVANGVDVSMTVELAATATPEVMDPRIRTITSIVMDNAKTKLTQAELIRQVKALTGISNVVVPLTKFAKTDGAYDIDTIIPTGTPWLKLSNDPAFAGQPVPTNSFVTQFPVLPDTTIPSGGLPDAFVGMLYEGQTFRRALSVVDFFNSSEPSFYIIGGNDQIDATHPLSEAYAQKILLKEDPSITAPTVRSYRVTFQVFNEGGTKDINISSTEYLVPGRVVINFITGS